MSQTQGNKSVLTFQLLAESINPVAPGSRTPLQLINAINSEPWMGKEAGSCKVIDIQQARAVPPGKTALMGHAEFTILVGYRPPGWISDVRDGGRQRLNGWTLQARDQTAEGMLLNGHGEPLPHGMEAVYLSFHVYEKADFNEYDFGQLISEI